MMDNNNSQTMQNWKKQIIMDGTLNYLFDSTLTPQQFFQTRILPLDQSHMVNIYTKLASLKHALSKNIQKEVQSKYHLIESSFASLNQLHLAFPKSDRANLQNAQKYLEKFNTKFQNVETSLQKWKNISKILRYSQSLSNFYLNVKLLKTILRDSKDIDNKMDNYKDSTNYFKASKIIKQIIYLSQANDFNGVPVYENQKLFIKNSKDLIYNTIQKQLSNALINKNQLQIIQKVTIIYNINKLNDFTSNYFKSGIRQIIEILRKVFNSISIDQFSQIFSNSFRQKICKFTLSIVLLQESMKKIKLNPINLFDKSWEYFINYIKDFLKEKLQQQAKQKQKQREKCLNWRYPMFIEYLSNIANAIHSQLIQNTKINFYEFSTKKQQLINTLLGLSQLFYKGIQQKWKAFIDEIQSNEGPKLLQIIKATKLLQLLNWIISKIKNHQILTQILRISNPYIQTIRKKCIKHQIINQFYCFLGQLKNIYTSNKNFQINNIQILQQFLTISQIDKPNTIEQK